MSKRQNNNRLVRGIIGLLLIIWGLNALTGMSLPFGFIMLIAGIALMSALVRGENWTRLREQISDQWDEFADFSFSSEEPASRRGGSSTFQPRSSERGRAARRAGKMHRVAVEAIRSAGQDPQTLPVAPVDIGVLAYESENKTPSLYRETRLPERTAFVRPFALLRSPSRARGTIRFELVDGSGDTCFVDETKWELKQGETFVYPDTWLPADRIIDTVGDWQLRIYAAGMLLAIHEFTWWDEGGGDFRAYLTGDGEISDDLVEDLSSARLGRLSLDDLLDDQEGGLIETDPEAEAAARRNAMINRQHNRRR
jgi:hypothetical protein